MRFNFLEVEFIGLFLYSSIIYLVRSDCNKMCFAIPYKIEKILPGIAVIEGGKKIKIDKDLKLKSGDFIKITGEMAVEKISRSQGREIRSLIKSLYENE